MSYNFIDLFAGAGGLSEGFIQAGFNPIAHVEMEKAACYTLKTRTCYHYLRGKNQKNTYIAYLKGEITRDQLYNEVPARLLESVINMAINEQNNSLIQDKIDTLLGNQSVDLIIGGPPCQAYSLVGRARSKTKMEGDHRNYLFVQYAEYLDKYKPKMFVFENVLGLKSAKGGHYLRAMETLFYDKGYTIHPDVLNARDFGVLQNRKRYIIIGCQKNSSIDIPSFNFSHRTEIYSIKELLKDLPSIFAGEGKDKYLNYSSRPTEYLEKFSIRNGINVLTQHIARPHQELDKQIYKIVIRKWLDKKERLNYNDLPESLKTHTNRTSFIDRFKVVAENIPYSQTVVAHIAKDGHYYIHPDIEQCRSISIREAARLQSFPDDYYFEGEIADRNRTAAFKQIGNAVPPLMANNIAHEINKVLCQTK